MENITPNTNSEKVTNVSLAVVALILVGLITYLVMNSKSTTKETIVTTQDNKVETQKAENKKEEATESNKTTTTTTTTTGTKVNIDKDLESLDSLDLSGVENDYGDNSISDL